MTVNVFFFRILFIFIERGREEEREGEKHQCVVASHTPRTGDLACNPGMCPDLESNQPLVHRLVLNPLSRTNQGSPLCVCVCVCVCFVGKKSAGRNYIRTYFLFIYFARVQSGSIKNLAFEDCYGLNCVLLKVMG